MTSNQGLQLPPPGNGFGGPSPTNCPMCGTNIVTSMEIDDETLSTLQAHLATIPNIDAYMQQLCPAHQALILKQSGRSNMPMNELSLLSHDATPEGFIVNDQARNEMVRIGRAAHLNQDFQIFQPTLFSLGRSHENVSKPLVQSTASIPGVNDGAKDPLSSLLSLSSNISGSYGSCGIGSSRSVDSNISQSSVPSTSGGRTNIPFDTSRINRRDLMMQLANLECERHNIDMQIERLRELAKYESQMNNQGN